MSKPEYFQTPFGNVGDESCNHKWMDNSDDSESFYRYRCTKCDKDVQSYRPLVNHE